MVWTDWKEKFDALLQDEDEAMAFLKSELSPAVDLFAIPSFVGTSTQQALSKAVCVVQAILAEIARCKISFEGMDPGHGNGHLVRDYVNGLTLFSRLDARPNDLYIGLMAGSLHDIGCSIVHRYEESNRRLRHAEVGALLLLCLTEEKRIGLSVADRVKLVYAVSAHTHYIKPQTITDSKGRQHTIEPYADTFSDGSPIWPVWFCRWVDRLDCNGICFPARHYLTLVEPHKDYGTEGFYDINFSDHMRPILRVKPEGPRTMVEHLQMFANSQTNDSPFGRYDYGRMSEMRDLYQDKLKRVIEAVASVSEYGRVSPSDRNLILRGWSCFLRDNIEPTAACAVELLESAFERLPADTQTAWLIGFMAIMQEYPRWARAVCSFLSSREVKEEWLSLPGITDDVRRVIYPSYSWWKDTDGWDELFHR